MFDFLKRRLSGLASGSTIAPRSTPSSPTKAAPRGTSSSYAGTDAQSSGRATLCSASASWTHTRHQRPPRHETSRASSSRSAASSQRPRAHSVSTSLPSPEDGEEPPAPPSRQHSLVRAVSQLVSLRESSASRRRGAAPQPSLRPARSRSRSGFVQLSDAPATDGSVDGRADAALAADPTAESAAAPRFRVDLSKLTCDERAEREEGSGGSPSGVSSTPRSKALAQSAKIAKELKVTERAYFDDLSIVLTQFARPARRLGVR